MSSGIKRFLKTLLYLVNFEVIVCCVGQIPKQLQGYFQASQSVKKNWTVDNIVSEMCFGMATMFY